MTTLAFDVYGTLIDITGVTKLLGTMIGDRATEFSNLWRQKQLEYTWRYSLMGRYRNFRICTSQALDYCCDQLDAPLSEENKNAMMARYLTLPVFADVMDGLARLQQSGVSMYAFSNGVPEDLEQLLDYAGITQYLDGIVSVDPKQTFKPNPVTYQHFMDSAGSSFSDTWLISSNGFDVCGALATGMQAFWLQRSPAVKFDYWEWKPTKIVHSFSKITDYFVN